MTELIAARKNDRIAKAGVTSKDDLKPKAVAALRRLQKLPWLVRSFFADPHLRYIAAGETPAQRTYLRTA